MNFWCGAIVVAVLWVGAIWVWRRVGVVAARAVVRPARRPEVRVHAVTPTTVTLSADERTLHRGLFGMWFSAGGHAVVGRVRGRDPRSGTVTRELVQVTGELRAGTTGRWTGHIHSGPDALGWPWEEVAVSVPGGVAPAWLIRPGGSRRSTTWAIHIHGMASSRVATLRSVPAMEALGMASLVVSYRGDGEGPPIAGGASRLGADEWEDVDAAIGYALAHGAERVVLVGWSLGGAIALLLTERSAHRSSIDRLVLIGPVTEWRAAIRSGARARGLPRWVAAGAIRALSDPRSCRRVGLDVPIDFFELNWARPERLTIPALVLHSAGDREVPLSASVLFAMGNPALVRLVELPPAAHGLEYNVDPAAFDRAVTEFLDPAREDDLLG